MKIHYYKFPENISENVRLSEGCAVRPKTGGVIFVDSIPDDKRDLVDFVDVCISGLSLKNVKKLIK